MPGVYQPNEFDVAGTIVGVVERDDILPRKNLQAGDVLIGLASSGPHTNGYSLIRKVFADTPLETFFPELNATLADALLAPHRSYYSILYPLLSQIKALAHLTGGGFIENIPRILPDNLGRRNSIGLMDASSALEVDSVRRANRHRRNVSRLQYGHRHGRHRGQNQSRRSSKTYP